MGTGPVAEPEDLSLIHKTHLVEGENQLWHTVLLP